MKRMRMLCLWMALAVVSAGLCWPAAAEEGWDLGGRTVTLGSYADLTPSERSDTYAEQMQLIEMIERKYHCKLEFVTTNDFHAWDSTVKTMAMSGEKVADAFCHVIDYVIPSWIYADLLAPLDEYVDVNAPQWNQAAAAPWTYRGRNYTVSTSIDAPGALILFNKRICAENGITDEMLYELQANREWTWSKLLELAQKCTRDTDGDGETDVWGFGAYGPAPVIAESFVYSNGAYCARMDENLALRYGLTDPAAIEALEWCRMLVNDAGVCYRGDTDWGTWEKLWNRGKVAFFQVYSWLMDSYTSNLANDEFGVLLIPMGPQAQDYINAQNVHDGWFIQQCVEDKAAIGAILTDYLYPYEWRNRYEHAWEVFENVVFDDESLDTIDLIEGRSVLALGENATWFRDNVLWYDFGVNSNTPGRVFAETNEAPSQAAFDELLVMFQDQMEHE